MSSRSTQSLAQSLEALFGHDEYKRLIELGKQAQPEDVTLTCPRCKDAGWLRLDAPTSSPDFGQLVKCRCGLVDRRQAKIYTAKSRIPEEYAGLDLTTYPDQKIAGTVEDWWRRPQSPWLLLGGDLGVGKTGLTISVVKLALAEGKAALYRPFVELLSDIRATFRTRDASEPDEADLMNTCKSVELLALDDLGAERVTGWAQERLFEILNHRYNERRRTILSTNLGPVELEEHVGDRIFSRIDGMAWVCEIVGPNLRQRR